MMFLVFLFFTLLMSFLLFLFFFNNKAKMKILIMTENKLQSINQEQGNFRQLSRLHEEDNHH